MGYMGALAVKHKYTLICYRQPKLEDVKLMVQRDTPWSGLCPGRASAAVGVPITPAHYFARPRL